MSEKKIDGYTINTAWNQSGLIEQTVDWGMGDLHRQLVRQVMDTKESQIREALIALGWTPPSE